LRSCFLNIFVIQNSFSCNSSCLSLRLQNLGRLSIRFFVGSITVLKVYLIHFVRRIIVFKKAHLKSLLGATMIGAMAAISTPAMATNEAMLDLLKILKDKGSITQAEYELLENAAKADGEKVEGKVNEMSAKVDKATKKMPKINTKGKLEIASQDGNYKWRVGGRLQADTTFGLGDVNFGSEAGNPITEFRRARIYLSGEMHKLWKFKFQYDFAGQAAAADTAGIRDAYIAYKGFKPVTITLGHHKMPLSMEELTSSKYITFIERSQLVNGIVADTGGGRQYGISAKGHFNDMFTAALGAYAGTANEDASDSQTGLVGRVTFSPIHEKTKMVHLGLGFEHSRDQSGGFNIDGEPEIHPGRDILENEGGTHRESNTWVAEAAAIYGPWSIQAEYASNELSESNAGIPDIDADAWYIYGSYYLTGESRNYKWKKGSYSQTKVKNPLGKGGYGAWEVALRFTSGDYENDIASTASSDADIITAGLNWYPINNVRFSANYVNVVDSNTLADGELAADLDAGSTADDAEYFLLRGQWYF
jgi:phosphate-selective porin OprO/OprP